MVTEETARRVADALERLERVLERLEHPAYVLAAPVPHFDLRKCAYCGGEHGGLSCPKLAPISICTGENTQ